MIMNSFERLKAEIIRRGYEANACDAIHDAEDADMMEAFFDVVKDNFNWCIYEGVIDIQMIEANKELFNDANIYANEVHHGGYCLIDGDIDTIGIAAYIYVCGNATVNKVFGNATVNKVFDNATVNYVSGNATVNSLRYLSCLIKDNAVLRVLITNTLYTRMNVEF